jgi:hypothetical protein
MTPQSKQVIRVPITVELDIEVVSRQGEKAPEQPNSSVPDDLGYTIEPEATLPERPLILPNGDR